MDPKPSILIFDLDGTLAESKQPLTPGMGETLKRLLSVMPVAIMSGASFGQFQKEFFASMPADSNWSNLYIFADNAAQCFRYVNGAWQSVYDQTFTKEEREEILEKLKEALADAGQEHDPTPVWGPRIEDRGAQISFSPLGQQAPLEAKQNWHDMHNDIRVRIHAALTRSLPNFASSMGGLTTIDITRQGITKAYGIRQMQEMTGTPIEKMLYVGDALQYGGNDFVVVPTGIPTRQVSGPEDTKKIIEKVLSS